MLSMLRLQLKKNKIFCQAMLSIIYPRKSPDQYLESMQRQELQEYVQSAERIFLANLQVMRMRPIRKACSHLLIVFSPYFESMRRLIRGQRSVYGT